MNPSDTSRDAILLESGTNEVEFIEFYLGGNSYGINVSKVQRVLARSSAQINRVAQVPECVKGIIHIHDKPVMLMDLKEALGIPFNEEDIDPGRQLVLVTTFNKVTTAFLIDGISKIHRTSWEDFEQLSEKVSSQDYGGFATGTVTLNDNIIIILDLERLMLKYFPQSHSHGADASDVEFREERKNVNIVYAEDSRMVRGITEKILAEAGYTQVTSFENGYEALQHLIDVSESAKSEGKVLNEVVDLVLTDIEMPKLDGLTLCRRVKTNLAAEAPPKVIVYSSLINKEMEMKCQTVGADAQLAKPDIDIIVDLIDQYCLHPQLAEA